MPADLFPVRFLNLELTEGQGEFLEREDNIELRPLAALINIFDRFYASLIVRNGTLKPGDIVVAGTTYAKVRVIRNEHNQELKQVTPGMPAKVYGWKALPGAGDELAQAVSEVSV